ncbi:hypothetical protein HMPREF0645_2133 [Hallella bergensis DSM 17361]|uniref:Uncharacterized protein n=1 Tax=Hallella bergensis DSM 17361 TaxID=585502 RepID=D1PYU8_9BACT|nr:hypothetical protein HMPREF0645_2133 [Hallella bergensis DSM 17361]
MLSSLEQLLISTDAATQAANEINNFAFIYLNYIKINKEKWLLLIKHFRVVLIQRFLFERIKIGFTRFMSIIKKRTSGQQGIHIYYVDDLDGWTYVFTLRCYPFFIHILLICVFVLMLYSQHFILCKIMKFTYQFFSFYKLLYIFYIRKIISSVNNDTHWK